MVTKAADLIGTAEAARILGKSHRTVHRLVQSGELVPAVIAPGGFNGSFLFTRSSVTKIASEQAKARRSQKAGA